MSVFVPASGIRLDALLAGFIRTFPLSLENVGSFLNISKKNDSEWDSNPELPVRERERDQNKTNLAVSCAKRISSVRCLHKKLDRY